MLSLIGKCRDGKGEPCDRDGVMRLVAPDGLVVPGCFMCRQHAEECVIEYAEKLGERWTMLDVRTGSRIDRGQQLMNRLLTKVSLASAAYYQTAYRTWFDDFAKVPQRFRRAGCRVGTIRMSLEDFARRFGDPHESAPREQWRNYNGHDLLDGAGKVSARWFFETPRGPLYVSDYWWNAKDELSIGAMDSRAMRWFRRWCAARGIPAE